MLDVLIVDDEKSIREGMKYVINWEEQGFRVIDTARNGMEALEIIKTKSPHLVITDIRMPLLSGLDLVKQAKELNQEIAFIALSGYNEFEYAKKAIDYNVKGYLLKPVDEEELISLLSRIKNEWDEKEAIRKAQLYSILNKLSNGDDNIEYNNGKHLGAEGDYYYLLVEIDIDEKMFCTTNFDHRVIIKLPAIYKIIEGFIGKENSCYIIKNEENGYGMVVNKTILCEYDHNIKKFALKLQKEISNLADISISIHIGKKVDFINEIYQSKQSITVCKKHKFYRGTGQFLYFDELNQIKLQESFNNIELVDQFQKVIKKGSKDECDALVNTMCRSMADANVSPEIVKIHIGNLVMTLIKLIDDLNGDITKITAQYTEFNKINGITINMVNTFLRELCAEMIEYIHNMRTKKDLGVIGDIMDYVDEHFAEEMNLQEISKLYYMNASYLGQLFKRKTGMSFNAYLNYVRIEKAKGLLENSDLKIYQVAQEVGFQDPNYFCTKFEELVKASPSEYKTTRKNKINI